MLSKANSTEPVVDEIYTRIYSLIDSGKNEDALVLTRNIVTSVEKEGIERDSNFLRIIENVALIYYKAWAIDTAIYYQAKYLGMYRKLFGPASPRLADYITMLAIFYEANGELAEAEPYYRESLSMNRSIYKSDHSKLANSIGSLAYFLDTKGDNNTADSLYRESLDMYRRIYKTAHPSLAIAIGNYAVFLNTGGRYSEAENLYLEALDIKKQLYDGDHPELVNAIGNLAFYYDGMSNFSKAEILYKEALEMARRLFKGDNPLLASTINNYALFLSGRGSDDEAEALFREAYYMRLRLYTKDHPDLATIILNMAYFNDKRKQANEADSLYKKALAMYRRLYPGDHPYLATCINSYATFLKSLNRLDEAEPLYIESLEMKRRLYKSDHPDKILSLNNLAIYLDLKGRFAEAEKYFREALEMASRLFKPGNQYLANIIFNTASFLDKTDRSREAAQLYKEALENYRLIIESYFVYLSDKEKKILWDIINTRFEVFNSFAVSVRNKYPELSSDMYDNQLLTKSMLFNSYNKIRGRILNSGDSTLINDYKKWKDTREYIIRLYSYPQSKLDDEKINLDSIEYKANELEKSINLKSEAFTESQEKANLSWNLIRKRLKSGEAAVEVVRFRLENVIKFTDTVIYAFLVIKESTIGQPELIIMEDGNLMETDYYNYYRSSLKLKRNDTRSFNRYWAKLYKSIKDCKTIYFSADGIYNKLNPSCLLMEDGRYLMDVQDIRNLNSTRDMLKRDGFSNKTKDNKAVLVGNPDFDYIKNPNYKNALETGLPENSIPSASFARLKKLPGAEKEVKEISDYLIANKWEVKSYLGENATKNNLKKTTSPRILHIATHGFFLEDIGKNKDITFGMTPDKVSGNPLLRSGLFFAGANAVLKSDSVSLAVADNGLLTSFEAMDLDLDKTELVVLSACETGLGEIMNGEGVYGLRRAFQQAGAKSVIMSLWTVDDQSTKELMTDFYRNWIGGMSRHDAFVRAQNNLRSVYPHPYYWGCFLMTGE